MTTNAVLKYLRQQNRPFSANDLASNLKDHGKTAIQKGLDELVINGKVMEKIYGKQKVYCIMQEDEKTNPEKVKQETELMDKEIINLSEMLQRQEQKLKNFEFELKHLMSSLTTEEAKIQKEKLEEEVDKLKGKLKILSENSTPICPEKKQKIETEYNKYETQYKKRKRICMDMINAIEEGYPKTRKHLIEEIGLEMDDHVNSIK